MQAGPLLGQGVRAATAAVLLASALLLAWTGSHWFWRFTVRPSGPPPAAQETDPGRAAATVGSTHLFGEHVAAASTQAAANMTLSGIVSREGGKPGVAIIAVGGARPMAAKEGDELAPGIRLLRVAPELVELSQHGRTVELVLPVKK